MNLHYLSHHQHDIKVGPFTNKSYRLAEHMGESLGFVHFFLYIIPKNNRCDADTAPSLTNVNLLVMKELKRATKASTEEVDRFLKGSDPQERIIKIECGYKDRQATVIYRDVDGHKHYDKQDFYPFCWAKQEAGRMMCGGNREKLKLMLQQYNIRVKALTVADSEGNVHERMESGYRVMFEAARPMSAGEFSNFFDKVGVPMRPKEGQAGYGKRWFISVAPAEQFMISTGKRLFKGYESYDDLVRFSFDLETEGLEARNMDHKISQIGMRTNKGFERIIEVEGDADGKRKNEMKAIREMFECIGDLDPDIVTGYNIENFDFDFIDARSEIDEGLNLGGCYKKERESILKLGGEIEKYRPTVMWGKHVTDCLFSVRRAQALDSNMKKANLKYVTKYSKIAKKNRVYLPGNIIDKTWRDTEEHYAFNDDNGDWYMMSDDRTMKDGYTPVSGRYIAQRYLLDDLWETDKVELRYNESNFLVGKMLPVNFERMCTMGTATIWKYIMLAWSYEHGLAIPKETDSRSFTGGLSRLLTVGYIPNVLKLDYNSLYPSIILTFGIKTPVDISDAMPAMLDYVLTNREKYKGLKGKYGKEAEKISKEIEAILGKGGLESAVEELRKRKFEAESLNIRNDKLQLPLKVTGNAYFGAFGSGGGVFYWADMECAEETTCSGRQMLRLMLKWFTDKGYQGIVCDSVTGDTPLFVKDDKTGWISIKPIEELFTDITEQHSDGREYDRSKKDYKILSRSGWVEPKYFYRHTTDKDVYRVTDGVMTVDATKDHSLFDENRNEIKPTEIKEDTKLEYYNGESIYNFNTVKLDYTELSKYLTEFKTGKMDRIPDSLLNATVEWKAGFISHIHDISIINKEPINKTLLAGYQYLVNCCTFRNF